MDENKIIKSLEISIENGEKLNKTILADCLNIVKKSKISFGYTPLTFSALYGNTEAIKSLVRVGLDINQLDSNNFSPLMISARKNRFESVKLLVKLGANVNALTTGHQHTALFEALLWDRQDIASFLIKKGTKLDLVARSGLTVLHIASTRNLQGIVEQLLASKVNTKIKDNDNKTALDYAIEKGHIEVINIFKRYGKSIKHLKKNIVNNSDISVIDAKLTLPKLISSLKFAKRNNLIGLQDDLAIQLASTIQKIILRGYDYKSDARLIDANIKTKQMNCQSRSVAYMSFFQEIPLNIKAVLSPGHVVIVHELSNGTLLVMDDVIKQISDYSITKDSIIYSDFFPSSKWGLIGNPEHILLSSYFQMTALKLKQESKYNESNALFIKAIDFYPNYPYFHFDYSISLRFSGDKSSSVTEYELAMALMKKISEGTEKSTNQTKLLSDAVLLGEYHFSYESFLVMMLDNKDTKGYEKNTLSILLSLSRKFKLPESIIEAFNKLPENKDAQSLIEESSRVTTLIYDHLSINSNSKYAYLYALALSKDTYLKLLEYGFPNKTLEIYETATRKQAINLGLPTKVVNNIVSPTVDYENIIEMIK